MDVECMVDAEWIDSLKNGGMETEYVNLGEEIRKEFVSYCKNFTLEADCLSEGDD